MTNVVITRSSGLPFPKHQPVKLSYTAGYAQGADTLTYECGIFDKSDFDAKEEFTFEVTPGTGDKINFTGVLFDFPETADNRVRSLNFVSKYTIGLHSYLPLYGQGNLSNVLKACYRAADVLKTDIVPCDRDYDAVCFPRTMTTQEAITYLERMALVDGNSYVATTIINDTAYGRNVCKGKQQISGVYYIIEEIRDSRKYIDLGGGLSVDALSDSIKLNKTSFTMKGTSLVVGKAFHTYESVIANKARTRVAQLKQYFKNYIARISQPGFQLTVGNNFVVDENDLYSKSDQARKQLLRGTYFIMAQELSVDFSRSMENTASVLQKVA